MIIRSKKGTELTLQMVVVFIILIIVLFVMIYFFTNHYGQGANDLFDAGNNAIDSVRD